ncbi:MAG: GNAT family N-acetyltransferase, partial [Myxococcales bacterium]|nr:GNAT family N-acetyltransferase [Myxococcales bacterium]
AYEMTTEEVWDTWRQAPVVRFASTLPSGEPVLRTVHGVVIDGAITFHGGDSGEKLACLGRPAVMQCEQTIAEIPSYFIDPQRACPATTYYVSCQAQGTLERVDDPPEKARALAALMARFQAEGGYTPIAADHALYRKAVDAIVIVRMRPTTMVGKRKLGQNRPTQQIDKVLGGLWRRGRPGDLQALEWVRAEHPGKPTPAFLQGPPGIQLCVHPGPDDLDAAVALVRDAYWNDDTEDTRIRAAHKGATAWVGARNAQGQLVATSRAISDGSKHAHIYDVAVHPAHRGRGVGKAMLALMLDHPRLRECTKINLVTRDAHSFYAPFGFRPFAHRYTEMRRARPQGPVDRV